ncbi:hypothetical protein MPH_09992 [Macrophomina phaseolina MS6]|uniref:Nephrocystin 3-like N-terminal domain-containing protein n=1 Tax=Macrophomina phaseolina (strain MS6) TaxID=1126212 RepID=K2RE79_MACPH|nr:hypothetical protein MPH_09992 [Macrophomina phaseolina MS6]
MRNRDQAVSFIENRTVLGDAIQHDAGLQLWTGISDGSEGNRRRQIWAEAEIEKEALAQAIENYQTKVLKKAGKSDVRQTKWNGMMKQVQEAVKLYENDKMTGVKGKVKWALHRIRDGSKTMEHWCNLLPGGDYGGTIAGVFSMLATAASKSHDVRESIFEAAQDVPDYIRATGDYLDIYEINRMDELEEKSAELCKAILVLFRLIMQHLTVSSARRMVSAAVQGDSYGEDLQNSKEQVERLAKKIRREAKIIEYKRISEVLGQTREIAAGLKRAEASYSRIENMLKDGSVPLADIGKCLQALLSSSQNFNVKTGQVREGAARRLLPGSSSHITHHRTRQKSISDSKKDTKRFLKLLQFEQERHEEDLETCTDLHASFDLRSLDEATWVVQSEELQLWLALPESRDLLINGNRSDSLELLSPLSVVCSELVRVCSIPKDTIVASYFCGLHTDYDTDEGAGFAGMIASLLGQIVHQSKTDEYSLNLSLTEEDREGLRELDLECLCSLFEKVVRQLPKDRIFYCIIDGVSLYEAREGSRGSEDAVYTLKRLYEIVDGARGKNAAPVKLLLTCPGESLNAGDPEMGFSVEAGEILNVDCVDGDRQGVWQMEELEESVCKSRSS